MRLFWPFHEAQVSCGATFINYLDHEIAAYYTTPEEELLRVRTSAAFTEYEKLGHLAVRGRDALRLLQALSPTDIAAMVAGDVRYTVFLDDAGGIIEDAVVSCVDERYFIIHSRPRVNRRNPTVPSFLELKEPKDWLREQATGLDVCMYAMGMVLFSIQGPSSRALIEDVVDVSGLEYRRFRSARFRDIPVLVARMGYSGELGYELYVWPEYANEIWDIALELGMRPYGSLASRIISLEKGYLADQDFYAGSTPVELGLESLISREKGEYRGRAAIESRLAQGVRTRLVGFEVEDPAFDFTDPCRLVKQGAEVGEVTAGAFSPFLRKNLGRGWVPVEEARAGATLEIAAEGRSSRVRIASSYRWYDPQNARLR